MNPEKAKEAAFAVTELPRPEDEIEVLSEILHAGRLGEGLYRALGYERWGVVPDFAVANDEHGMIGASFFAKRLQERPTKP